MIFHPHTLRVVLATGFIHMLPAAMGALSDECLPDSWLNYEAYAGLFAMLAALAMQLIEFIAHQHYHPREEQNKLISTDPNQTISVSQRGETVEIVRTPSDGHQHGLMFQDSSKQHKISTYLLEFGIALHSVLIGVALGTTIEEFEALLIALCFHQFFEGMALGAQIAGVKDMSTIAAIGMVLFFALTTPVGVAIGIGVHLRTYNPKSVAALLVNGIFDSVSAGILIYVSLVNLINGDMGPHAKAFHQSKTRLKVLYFVALYLGVAAMSVIGRWA